MDFKSRIWESNVFQLRGIRETICFAKSFNTETLNNLFSVETFNNMFCVVVLPWQLSNYIVIVHMFYACFVSCVSQQSLHQSLCKYMRLIIKFPKFWNMTPPWLPLLRLLVLPWVSSMGIS